MPTFLNLCRRSRQGLLCSLLFLPFFGSIPQFHGFPLLTSLPRYPTGHAATTDTIGRITDRRHRRDLKYWNRQESNVIDRYLSLVQQLRQLQASGKQDDQQAVLHERIRRLKIVLATLDILRYDSLFYYNIRKVPSNQGTGETVYDPCSREIAFRIQDSSYNTYSFVHETTHGLQFMQGEMVFDRSSGSSVGDDIGDELEAYRNQFAYDTASISGVHLFAEIDSTWLRSLKDRNGVFLYSPDISRKYNVIGLKTVTVDSDTTALKEAYPKIRVWGNYPYPLKDQYHFFFRERRLLIPPE